MRVRWDGFEGDLPELLAAVDNGTVDPATLPLQEVLAQVRAAAGDLDAAVGAFVALAHLVERKARALLPVPPPAEELTEERTPEEEEQALAERLAAYEAFAEAAEALRAFERQRAGRFGRPAEAAAAVGPAAAPRPPAPGPAAESAARGDLERLLRVFAEVWERAQPRTREVRRERWSVAMAVRDLRRHLAQAGSADFAELFAPDADRLQVVVTFLAILEMVRQGEVAVHQEGPFAPLRIEWKGARGEGGAHAR